MHIILTKGTGKVRSNFAFTFDEVNEITIQNFKETLARGWQISSTPAIGTPEYKLLKAVAPNPKVGGVAVNQTTTSKDVEKALEEIDAAVLSNGSTEVQDENPTGENDDQSEPKELTGLTIEDYSGRAYKAAIAHLKTLETKEAIKAAIVGETRESVLNAATELIEQLEN